MGLTVSKPTAQKIIRLISRADHTPVFVPEKPDCGAVSRFDDVRIAVVQSGDAANGWLCSSYPTWAAFMSGTSASTIRLWVTELAGDAELHEGDVVVAHHVIETAVGGNDYGV